MLGAVRKPLLPERVRIFLDFTVKGERTMRSKLFLILNIFFAILAFTLNTSARDSAQWHLPEGAKMRLGKGRISDIAYSPDGTRLVVGSSIGIWLYDAQTRKELDLITGHTGGVSSVSFSPDGKTLASGSSDGTIRLWVAETGQHICTLIGYRFAVRSVVFSPDGKTLASGHDHSIIRLWDVETGQLLPNFTTGTNQQRLSIAFPWIASLAFSPDGKILASVGSNPNISLWDVETGQRLHTLTGHTGFLLNSVVFSPDGKTIASVGHGNIFHLWNVETGQTLHTLTGHTGYDVLSVVFSPDGRTIASGSGDGTVLLWDVAPSQLREDVNQDGVVNIQDLVVVANAFGETEPDLNNDGVVNIQDLVIVTTAFGRTVSAP